MYFMPFAVEIYNFCMFYVSIFMSQEIFVGVKERVYKAKSHLNQSKLIRSAALYKVFRNPEGKVDCTVAFTTGNSGDMWPQ